MSDPNTVTGYMGEDRRTIRWLLRSLGATLFLFAIFGFMVRYNQVQQNRTINNLSQSVRILTDTMAEATARDVQSREQFRVLANRLLELSTQINAKSESQVTQIRQIQEALARLENRPLPPTPRVNVTQTPQPSIVIPPQEPPIVNVPPPLPPQNECIVNLLGIKLLC